MTILHPHWQPTDDGGAASHKPQHSEEREHRFHSHEFKAEARSASSVSRRPAAILGILLSLSIGAVVMRDGTPLETSVTGDTLTVSITAGGFVPERLSLQPGQTVIWKNETQIPHILASETLRTENGKALQTSPIFPAATGQYTVPLLTTPGEYAYISQTDKLSGVLIVDDRTAAGATSSDTTAQATSAAAVVASAASAPSIEQNSSSDAATSAPSVTASVLPKNPHTVGTLPAGGLLPAQPAPGVPAYAATPSKPVTIPKTGPTLWIVAVASILALYALTRRHFRRLNID